VKMVCDIITGHIFGMNVWSHCIVSSTKFEPPPPPQFRLNFFQLSVRVRCKSCHSVQVVEKLRRSFFVVRVVLRCSCAERLTLSPATSYCRLRFCKTSWPFSRRKNVISVVRK
jgi:hypothetical protein